MTVRDELDRTILLCRDHVRDDLSDAEICRQFQSLRVLCVSNRDNLSSHSGQTALVTLVSLLNRMGIQTELNIPDIPIISPQPPLSGSLSLLNTLVVSCERLITGATVSRQTDSHPDLIFALGDSETKKPADPCWRLHGDAWSGTLSMEEMLPAHAWNADWPIGAMVSAAQAANEVFKFAMRRLPLRNEGDQVFFTLSRSCSWTFGPFPLPGQDVDLGMVDIISAGAISQAAMYALTRLPNVRMHGRIFDDDLTGASNLNRNMLTLRSDVGRAKALVVAERCNPNLGLEPIVARYTSQKLAARVLVGVDDIPSRWEVQRHAPGWLAVSGTSHFNISSSSHAAGEACSGCLHPLDDPAANPIPTISFISFWAGLAMAVRLLREVAGIGCPQNRQHLWLTPLRMDLPYAAMWSAVPAVRCCPVKCSASQNSLAA